MNFELIEIFDELITKGDSWNDLVSKLDQWEVFYEWQWVYTYLKEMDTSFQNSLKVLIIYEKKSLIAIFPFLNDNNILRFITNKTVDYNSIYIDKKCNKYYVIEKAMKFIFKNVKFSQIHLENFKGSSELYILKDVVSNMLGCYTVLEDSVMTPVLIRSDISKSKYRVKQIKDIDRRKRKIEKEHKVEINIDCTWQDDIWEFILLNHMKKWNHSIFKNDKYLRFYKKLNENMSDNIEMSKLEVDGKIVAAHFGFKNENKVSYYIPAYDEEYSSLGVGYILLNELIEYYSDKNEFDFLRGNESYKFNWTDSIGMNYNIYIFKPGFRNLIASFIMHIKIYFKKSKFLRKILNK